MAACCLLSACASAPAPRPADTPAALERSCARARAVCPAPARWQACRDDRWRCYRLGLWLEEGKRVPRDRRRAAAIFGAMCDRFEATSCQALCRAGQRRRCVDLALLGVAGAGGAPYPPKLEWFRPRFQRGCEEGDSVACMMLELDYRPGQQLVVRLMNDCADDEQRCFGRACDRGDPLACAFSCHTRRGSCEALARLASAGKGFTRPLPALARRLGLPPPAVEGDDKAVRAAVEAYRQAMERLDAGALEDLVHPAYHSDAGTPDPGDDLDRLGLLKVLRQRLGSLRSVSYAIDGLKVRWSQPGRRAEVDASITASYELALPGGGSRVLRHSDRNRFLLERHRGRWLFVSGM